MDDGGVGHCRYAAGMVSLVPTRYCIGRIILASVNTQEPCEVMIEKASPSECFSPFVGG